MISRRVVVLQSAFVFALALTACGGGGGSGAVPPIAPIATPLPTSSPSGGVSSETAMVSEMLAALRPEDRGEIIVFDNGQVYASSAELRATATYYRPTSDPDVYLDANGSPILFPAVVDDPSLQPAGSRATRAGEGQGTGIAHSWYSNPGYSYMSADVSIPCSDTTLSGDTSQGPRQGAYIYGGGISATGLGADVGIMFNPPDGTVGVPRSVQAFINAVRSDGNPVGGGHLTCGASYRLTTYVTERNGNPYLVDALKSDSGGLPIVLMQRILRAGSGWSKVCARCRTKRVTSLAVKSGKQQTVVGTWFGLQQPYSSAPTPTVIWRDALQAFFTSATDLRPQPPTHWFESQGAVPGGDMPSDAGARGLLVVTGHDSANEDVGFNETGPRLMLQ